MGKGFARRLALIVALGNGSIGGFAGALYWLYINHKSTVPIQSWASLVSSFGGAVLALVTVCLINAQLLSLRRKSVFHPYRWWLGTLAFTLFAILPLLALANTLIIEERIFPYLNADISYEEYRIQVYEAERDDDYCCEEVRPPLYPRSLDNFREINKFVSVIFCLPVMTLLGFFLVPPVALYLLPHSLDLFRGLLLAMFS